MGRRACEFSPDWRIPVTSARCVATVVLFVASSRICAQNPGGPADYLRFERIETERGLEIVHKPRPGSGAVHVRVVVRVGSRPEPRALNGISHLLEHLVFSTPCGPEGQSLRKTLDRLGARHNGLTKTDCSVFYFEAATPDFAECFRYLAQCLTKPVLSDTAVEAEKKIVIEEIGGRKSPIMREVRKRLGADSFWQRLRKQLFLGDPVCRPIAGSVRKVTAITPKDLRRHHEQFYRPTNATLIVVGDADPERTQRMSDLLFPQPAVRERRITKPLPVPERAGRAIEVCQNLAVNPFRVRLYRGVRVGRYTPRHFARLLVLQQLMRAHLADEMREKTKLAYHHRVSYRQYGPFGYMYAKAEVASENRAAAERILRVEFERLREGRISDEEVRAATQRVRTALLLSCQSNFGMASFLAWHAGMADGIQEGVAELPEMISAVTRDDLTTFAREYIREDNSFRAVARAGFGTRGNICAGVAGVIVLTTLVIVTIVAIRGLRSGRHGETAPAERNAENVPDAISERIC